MAEAFQVDKYHFNNHLSTTSIGDRYSGFCLDDQSKALCVLFNEDALTLEQMEELQRVTLILAQQESDSVLRPLAWGAHNGRHYLVYPDFGRPLASYENLKPLPPAELLLILRRMLRALCFAEAKEVVAHQSLRPLNIHIALETSEVRLGFFGYPLVDLAPSLRELGDPDGLLAYFPPEELAALEWTPQQHDFYALGLVALELATAKSAGELLTPEDRLHLSAGPR
jgi:serine/threonine protein kinase